MGNKKLVTISISKEINDRFNEYAKENAINKSKFLENAMKRMIDIQDKAKEENK